MTVSELATGLNAIADTAHFAFAKSDTDKVPPYIAYVDIEPEIIKSDYMVHRERHGYFVEIYTAPTDYDTVEDVKAWLNTEGITWDNDDIAYLDEQGIIMTVIEIWID